MTSRSNGVRARKRAQGLKRIEVWVPRELERTVRAFLRWLVAGREKA